MHTLRRSACFGCRRRRWRWLRTRRASMRTAIGHGNTALGQQSVVFDINKHTTATGTTAFGVGNRISGESSSAFGNWNQARASASGTFGLTSGTEDGATDSYTDQRFSAWDDHLHPVPAVRGPALPCHRPPYQHHWRHARLVQWRREKRQRRCGFQLVSESTRESKKAGSHGAGLSASRGAGPRSGSIRKQRLSASSARAP